MVCDFFTITCRSLPLDFPKMTALLLRFNLGSLEDFWKSSILVVCDTTKTTYDFFLVWFGTRRSV